MQISRHWRIKPQRYRLEGLRYENGEISLQTRPAPSHDEPNKREMRSPQAVAQPIPTR
ncbi:MAG: hypothetical protein IT320_06300 [Anaerolineae bacterium]|nr:hypothetical protein [Anaerolineae bacterium]